LELNIILGMFCNIIIIFTIYRYDIFWLGIYFTPLTWLFRKYYLTNIIFKIDFCVSLYITENLFFFGITKKYQDFRFSYVFKNIERSSKPRIFPVTRPAWPMNSFYQNTPSYEILTNSIGPFLEKNLQTADSHAILLLS